MRMSLDPVPAIPTVSNNYRAGDLLIDAGVRQVTREGLELNITGRSFDLLLTLVRAAPLLVSTRELMDRVWPGVMVSPETLIQRIMLLRQGLGDSAESPRYVAAVRGHGYRMAAQVTTLAMLPAPAPAASADDTPGPSAAVHSEGLEPGTLRRIAVVLAGVLALVMSGAGLWWIREHHGGVVVVAASAPHPEAPRAEFSPAPRSSVAVMPFANLTGDPARDYLGDGMAEELISSLAQVPGLKVPARTSTFAYKGRNTDIRQIARELGVATVLEGSVRSAGARVRVGVRLVDAGSGFQIWSKDDDQQSPDLFKLQDDLAAQTVQALQGYMNINLPAPVAHPPKTHDVQAYDLYLQARAVHLSGRASLERAIAFLDQALVRDPDFADALGQRATLGAIPAALGFGGAPLLNDADRDAGRALALNPNSPDGHVARMQLQAVHWRWVEAEQSHRAAMVMGANDPYFRNFHSEWVLRPAGRLQQAEAEMMVSYHLAPADGYTLHELVLTESVLGHDAEAVRLDELWRGLLGDTAPQDGAGSLLYMRRALRMEHYAEAAQWATRAFSGTLRTAGGEQAMQIFCAALADPAKRPAARKALRDLVPHLLDIAEDLDRDKTFFVNALTMVGDLDGAYQLMGQLLDRRLARAGSGGDDWTEVWRPEMRPFRRDPRFQAFVTRVKLPDYWMQYGPPDDCDLKDGVLACH
jgi:transcriptional activator of cad operon